MVPCKFTFARESTKDSMRNLMQCNLCRMPKPGNRGSKVFCLEATDGRIFSERRKEKELEAQQGTLEARLSLSLSTSMYIDM